MHLYLIFICFLTCGLVCLYVCVWFEALWSLSYHNINIVITSMLLRCYLKQFTITTTFSLSVETKSNNTKQNKTMNSSKTSKAPQEISSWTFARPLLLIYFKQFNSKLNLFLVLPRYCCISKIYTGFGFDINYSSSWFVWFPIFLSVVFDKRIWNCFGAKKILHCIQLQFVLWGWWEIWWGIDIEIGKIDERRRKKYGRDHQSLSKSVTRIIHPSIHPLFI